MEQSIVKPKRPLFLTLVCICTYIGVPVTAIMSFLALGGIQSLITERMQMLNGINDAGNMLLGGGDVSNAMDDLTDAANGAAESVKMWLNVSIIIFGVLLLLCLIGAIMMWKLKRKGFYVYATGEMLPAIATLVFYLKIPSYMTVPSEMINLMYVFIGTSVLFTVLYALNFKHLK